MFRAKTVLVAVDFSETSEKAIETAIEVAAKFDGRVVLLHAYEIPALGFPDGVLVASSDVVSRIGTAAQTALADLTDKYRGRVPLETLLRTGPAYETVNAVAEELGADLIVIGTHGRKGLARALLGSVAENIIRTATRPVIVLHGPRD